MSAKTTVYIIRHGESIGNKYKILLGRTDLDLSALGYLQAEATKEELKDVKFDKIYSSPLIRAFNTAVPHAKMRDLTVNAVDDLMEIDLGEWENKSAAEIRSKELQRYDVDWAQNFGTFAFREGESTVECGERFYRAMHKIVEDNIGKTILVAAHGAVIRSFWAKISNIAPEDIGATLPYPTNASYSVLEYENGIFTPLEFSKDKHLAGVGITNINF